MKHTHQRVPACQQPCLRTQICMIFSWKIFFSFSLGFCLFQEFLVIIAFSLAVPHIISLYSFPLQRAMQMHPPLTLSIISNILFNTQTLSYFVHFWLHLYLRLYSSNSKYLCNNNPIQPSMHDINYFRPQYHCFGRECARAYLKNKRANSTCVWPSVCNTIKRSVIPKQWKVSR